MSLKDKIIKKESESDSLEVARKVEEEIADGSLYHQDSDFENSNFSSSGEVKVRVF